ncbi:MAG: hypothetical protein NC548_49260, partial [Lachnospiraceae bacterium]|nr:hypothetical protein [Lachnospiraceae bacterium]
INYKYFNYKSERFLTKIQDFTKPFSTHSKLHNHAQRRGIPAKGRIKTNFYEKTTFSDLGPACRRTDVWLSVSLRWRSPDGAIASHADHHRHSVRREQ